MPLVDSSWLAILGLTGLLTSRMEYEKLPLERLCIFSMFIFCAEIISKILFIMLGIFLEKIQSLVDVVLGKFIVGKLTEFFTLPVSKKSISCSEAIAAQRFSDSTVEAPK